MQSCSGTCPGVPGLSYATEMEGGDGREREAVVGSVESAFDALPRRPPTVTIVELRESLLTDN